MDPGRNTTRKKRKTALATLLLFGSAAVLAATPAGALSLAGAGAGQADMLWGATSGLASPSSEVEQDMAGSARTAAQAAANVEARPPDPQPHVDEATSIAMQAKAAAEAKAAEALATKDSLAGAGAVTWGISGAGDGAYDVVLGGSYLGGAEGVLVGNGGKKVEQRVDVRGHERAAAGAAAEAEGALDGLLAQLQELYGKARASFNVGLDGAAKALGSFGMDIAGLFGFQKSAEVANIDHLAANKRVDVAGPALDLPAVDLPEASIPSLALDQRGEIAADAAATARGIVQG